MTARAKPDAKKRRPKPCPECGGVIGRDGLFGGGQLTSYWSHFNDKRRAQHDHMNAHICDNKYHARKP